MSVYLSHIGMMISACQLSNYHRTFGIWCFLGVPCTVQFWTFRPWNRCAKPHGIPQRENAMEERETKAKVNT